MIMMFSLILSSLSLILIIISIILAKKIPLIASILLILNIIFILIKIVDPTYYNEIAGELKSSDDLDLILFAYSFILFVFCLSVFIVKLLSKMRKVNCRLDNKAIFSNLTQDYLDDESYKKIQSEFKASSIPIAIFDKVVRINTCLKELLNIDSLDISLEQFMSLIHEDDLENYKNGNYFRIKSNDYSDWYEKKSFRYQGRLLCVIKRIDNKSFSNFTIGEYRELKTIVNEYENSNRKYGLLMVLIKHIYEENKIQTEVDIETTRIVLTSKYLLSLKDFLNSKRVNCFKLENNEFAILVESNASFEYLLEKLSNNEAVLNDFCYFIGEKKYLIKTKVALCYDYVKEDVDSSIIDCVNKAMEMILETENSSIIVKENNIKIDIKKEIKE